MNRRGRRDPMPIAFRAPRLILVIALALCALALAPQASSAAWKPEPASFGVAVMNNVPITMSDGVVLRADVYSPTDPSTGQPAAGPFPVIVSETPYGKHLAASAPVSTGYESYLVQRGYIDAVVDVRGEGASGGTFALFGPQETADSVEVINWAARLPRSTGAVGMTGESYVGMTQMFAAGAVGPNSPLKAIFPVVSANDTYRDIAFDGGIFNAETDPALLGIYLGAGVVGGAREQPNDPNALLVSQAQHAGAVGPFGLALAANIVTGGDQAFDQGFWQARNPGNVLDAIVRNGIPAYLVGGLNDVYQRGEPLNFSGLQNAWAGRPVSAPMAPNQPVTGRYQLLQGPWFHLTVDDSELQPIQLQWFDRWLKGRQTGIEDTSTPLHVIQADGRHLEAARYPVDQATQVPYYLGADQTLTTDRPIERAAGDQVLFAGVSLPCNRSTDQWTTGAGQLVLNLFGLSNPCAVNNPAPPAGPSSLTYTTKPFTSPTVLAGPIDATLYATTSTRDSEWVATISDIASDGTATQITAGALLGSFRALDEQRTWRATDGGPLIPYHPYTQASQSLVEAGTLNRYDVEINSTFATLQPGHRLRLTIATGDTPHLLPTPPQVANLAGGVYEVQRRAQAASYVELPLGPAAAFAPGSGGEASTRGCPATLRLPISQRHGRVTRATVYVDRKRVKRARGRRIKAVTIPTPTKTSYSVRIVAVTRGAKRFTTVTRYRGCSASKARKRRGQRRGQRRAQRGARV